MTQSCTPDQLAAHPFARGLTPAQLARLAVHGQRRDLVAGTLILKEGQAADQFCLIHEGRVALFTYDPQGAECLVQELGPGEPLGWSWLLPPHQWHFSARAKTPVTLDCFDGAAWRAEAERDPVLGMALCSRLGQVINARLRATRRQIIAQMAE